MRQMWYRSLHTIDGNQEWHSTLFNGQASSRADLAPTRLPSMLLAGPASCVCATRVTSRFRIPLYVQQYGSGMAHASRDDHTLILLQVRHDYWNIRIRLLERQLTAASLVLVVLIQRRMLIPLSILSLHSIPDLVSGVPPIRWTVCSKERVGYQILISGGAFSRAFSCVSL